MAARFQFGWLSVPEFKDWISQVPDDIHKARCLKCHKTFALSNMGRRALISHAKSVEHIKRTNCSVGSLKIASLFSSVQGDATSSSAGSSSTVPELSCREATRCASGSSNAIPIKNTLKTYVLNDKVMRAEILWCLQTVMRHKSMRTASSDITLLKAMFQDSEIAQKMELQRTKMSYSILYGIAPYYKNLLITKLAAQKCYAVGFDESLNKVSQRTQMDLNIRFWNEEKSEVNTRYVTSVFLNRTTSDDLRAAFKEALSPSLSLSHIVQISMDGPNVNKKFFRELVQENQLQENPLFVNLGTCGLHTMNCAFKAAMKGTNWGIVSYLRSLYNIFKDVPARRGKYTELSGSRVFPKKFCSVRWLENSEVAERAIEILPNVTKYVNGVKDDRNRPTSASFKVVVDSVADPLLGAKLAFFISLASEVEPFLREFQTDAPMVPFLYTVITNVIKSVMARFVNADILSSKSPVDIDISKEKNLLPVNLINLGFGTRGALRKKNKESKIPDSNIQKFRKGCLCAMKVLTSKLMEKSPIAYPIVKALTCFDPSIAVNDDFRRTRVLSLLTILEEHRLITSSLADKAEKEFNQLCSETVLIEDLKSFSRNRQRVDHFWCSVFERFSYTSSIKSVMKMVMIFYHGNSNIERGFSVNKECVAENMKEETLIAQRIVYDSIISSGKEVSEIEITKSLVHYYKNARALQKEDVKKRDKEELEGKVRESMKRKLDLEKKEIEAKIKKIKENATKEVEVLTEKINSLKSTKL